MKLNVQLIKSVLTLYDELVSNGISIVYLGEFNHQITKMFTSMAQNEMERHEAEKTTKRIVYHTLVETLQNMNKHSDEIAEKKQIGRGLFMIGRKKDIYYIITSNRVAKDKISDLKYAIDEVNTSSKSELKKMYKKQLRYGKLTNKQGAGLGLIDIARKTTEKLDYLFLPIDGENYFFILKVEINAQKIQEERLKNKDDDNNCQKHC